MKQKTLTALIIVVALIHGAALPANMRARAQASAPGVSPAPGGGGSVSINNQAGRVQIKLERGSRVAINNRFGRITVTGWDSDTVEATATSERGAEAVQVEMTADPAAAQNVLTLNVPGRPGQRAPFPHIYMNPNLEMLPRIYMPPNIYTPSNPTNAPTPRASPAPQGSATPPPAKVKPAKPAKPAPRRTGNDADDDNNDNDDDNDDSNVILLPVPEVIEVPGAAVAPAPQPSPRVPAAARGGARGTGTGTGRLMGTGTGRLLGTGVGTATGGGGEGAGISLNVRLPRYALLDAIEVRSGDVNISDIDGPVSISSGSSNITVNRVGALEVRARSGNINVDGVEGLVYIVATSGKIIVRRAGGDVRATSINGDINIQCVRGRVDASNARGGIVLNAVGGDVEASTTDADINFTGAIRRDGRYRLKSMEGRVIMAIPDGSPGFTAILASYNKDVVTTFPITTDVLAGGATRVNRRVVVKQGDGLAQITLDSFGQPVYLTKLAPGTATGTCK
ncbi:MAG TPA: DUF4097 family beta strand repeat-containing protein [Pyrinomonadaceae bacterium]|nr:DUF4097 family beta strand repeat-containing protein [Pyrinomonadaceae bacterium]